jgi:hypothetical protein
MIGSQSITCQWVLCYCIIQGVDHFKKIQYAPGITYGELFLENEYFSPFSLILSVFEADKEKGNKGCYQV